MNDDSHDLASLRYGVYALLILCTLVNIGARILTAQSADRRTPFFSANDRSRWSNISALVDHGTFAIDRVRQRPGWKTIDMVRHPDREGTPRYYSSKPPLLATLLAPLYRAIYTLTGLTFAEHPFAIARIMLMCSNLLPFAIYLLLLTYWIEQHGETDFGRVFMVACACWGTLLTPFANSLNNHLPAAICVLIATFCLWKVWYSETPDGRLFFLAGLTAAFAAANELPALSFLVIVAATALWLSPRQTLLFLVPAILLVGAGFFLTNYLAHDSWRPPYAHRSVGENWYDYPGSYWVGGQRGVDLGEPSKAVYLFHVLLGHHGFFSLTPIWLMSFAGGVTWSLRGDSRQRFVAAIALGLLAVCVIFYVGLRPQGDRNYGGVASGFRWFFWLIPLWLLIMLPAADWASDRRGGRVVAMVLLGVSMLSAALPANNPWTHPWIYQVWQTTFTP